MEEKSCLNNPDNELTFELSERLFEGRCELNAKRLNILTNSFIRFCNSSERLKEFFKQELEELHNLDIREDELRRSSTVLLNRKQNILNIR